MNELKLPAPAKLNLFLHLTGRRPDGYHQLQTLFQFVDWCDWLTVRRRADGRITLSADQVPVPSEKNLVWQAAQALKAATGTPWGADLVLEKVLPQGGGLGGGSSDAATTLLALNHVWQTEQSLDQLAAIGLILGADVPVFVRGVAAWAEGVGEELTPVDVPEPWYVLLTPDAAIATADAFAHPQLTRDFAPITLRAFFAGATQNAFEPVARALAPAVDDAFRALLPYGKPQLTGTGSCVFLACDSESRARDILNDVSTSGIICRGMNQSLAHRALADISRKPS